MDMITYYSQLVGCRITGFRMEADDGQYGSGQPFPTFTMRTASGGTLEVQLSSDPEGNGGGFAFIGPGGQEGRNEVVAGL